ncbi:MAG: protein kinase [Acidobacteria bacterium]|nr:protein kinase [Acidobacteriota bacterium]MBI3427552.1 protein kinase [Acidobacteriota bacterium]
MQEWIGPGMVLGDYQIVARIEHEVFLVRAENGSAATLKLLAGHLAWEPATLKRFINAVKAAPPLDHRNICRTFDAGATQGGRPFVVSEVVHGRPLSALEIGLGRTLAARLELASQIAEAVAAAHACGVLHLELTPNKVLVEYDRQLKDAHWINEYADKVNESLVALNFAGRVKVLDFAVMMAALGAPLNRDTFSLQPFTSKETLPYCSPEWVSGEKLTPQSDIFSLGVLVYELLTGNRPFAGETLEEIRWSIFTDEPQSLTDFVPELSLSINQAVLKALAKDPEQRFRTAGAFAQALRGLMHEETESELQRAAAAAREARSLKLRWQGFWPQVLAWLNNHWRRGVAGSIVLFEIFFIAAILIHSQRGAREEAAIDGPREGVPLTRLTHQGTVHAAALAPDGKGLAYLIEEPERQSILFNPFGQQTKDGKPLPEILLVTSKTAQLSALTCAPSGDFVYYLSNLPGAAAELKRVPLSGGPVQSLLPEAASPVGFAPDRKQFALARSQGEQTQIVISGLNGQSLRVLGSWPISNALANVAPAWSHDGKTIVCGLRPAGHDFGYALIALDVASGQQRTLADGQWVEIYGLGWLPGDQALFVNARRLGTDKGQIWRVNTETRQLTALTQGVDDYRGLSLSGDGSRLLTVYTEHRASLWLGLDEQAQPLSATNIEAHAGFTWLNDNQLVYAVARAAEMELRETATDGKPSKLFGKLEAGIRPLGFAAASTTDTQNPGVIFAAAQERTLNLWQGVHGSAIRPLTTLPFALWPQLTAEGHKLLYSKLVNGKATLELKPLGAETGTQLLERGVWGGVASPKGDLLAANAFVEKLGQWQLRIWPLNGGPAVQVFELPGGQPRRLRWTPDGSALVYTVAEHGADNLWQQPLAGGSATPLTKLSKQHLYDFAWSPAGKHLALLRGEPQSDAVLLATDKLPH